MADIFISYASEDRDRVIPIVKALEEQGWSLFWDSTSIPVGKTWRHFINEGLEAARCILVIWSKQSVASEWVLEEADEGKERKILAPVLIDDVRPPRGFGQIQAARLIGWKGESSHSGFQQLIKALTGLLGLSKQKIANSIGMEFILIPAGSFTMGSSTGKTRYASAHEVKISQPFYLQTTEVSQGQWKKVMGENPSLFKECGDDCPVENVSWDDVQRFIEKLNQLEKTKAYRLPSEAEWEYACRAGTTTEYSFGDDSRILGEYAWYLDNSNKTTHQVATRKPNPWGLYDMHGNVNEAVEDDWHDSYEGAPADGRAWVDRPRGSERVGRGGSWDSDAQECRAVERGFLRLGDRCRWVGFRLAMSIRNTP